MSPVELLLPYQKEIVYSKSKLTICNCSRQIGKSFMGAAKAVVYAYTHPGTLTACISTGQKAASEFLLKCRQWCRAFNVAYPSDASMLAFDENAVEIRFGNGSRIITLPSGNPAALRGYTGNIILDEFALVDNDQEIWASIAPLLTSKMNNQEKWCLILSTPTSLDTQFAKIWFDSSDLWIKKSLTIYDAVNQGLKADPENLKSIINDDFIWRTEYLCEFASTAETAFPQEFLQNISEKTSYNPKLQTSIGADIARTSDLTVFSVIQKNNQFYHLIDLICLKNTPFNEQLKELAQLYRKYNASCGYIDATGIGNMFSEEASRTISPRLKPFIFTSSSKTELFERFRKIISNNQFRTIPEHEEVVKNDLAQMRRCISKNGSISYNAPHTKSGHADITCSIALAINALEDMPQSFALPETFARQSMFGQRFQF